MNYDSINKLLCPMTTRNGGSVAWREREWNRGTFSTKSMDSLLIKLKEYELKNLLTRHNLNDNRTVIDAVFRKFV